MIRRLVWSTLPLLPLLAAGSAAAQSLLPQPSSLVRGSGSVTIANGASVAASAPEAQAAARLLIDHVRTARGIALTPASGAARITFAADASVTAPEGYRLVADRTGIRILASAAPGFVHAAMTLAQLLSPDAAFGKPVRVPALTIDDAPRFAWRGLMLDTARHFVPLETVRRIVDQMAAVKLNTLHLHLTDDQGWRFEVKRYPKLTEVGAWRRPPSTGGEAPATRYGGFYTQDELRALVAYATERGVTIVPEIDLPGHATALVAAYPEYGVLGDRPPVGNNWGIEPYLLNPSPEGVAFVKNVLDELIAVFPGTFIHLGGDEAVKDQWQRSPAVQAQIKALGLADENALQSWLIDEFGRHLAAKGRRLIGWDEILEGGLPPSASVMSWRGEKGAVEAARQGHDVVLSPDPGAYVNSLQSDHEDEPPGRLSSLLTLADVYDYDAVPKDMPADKVHHILGTQVNAWSEYIVTPAQLEHVVFPRIAALGDVSWTKAPRDFPGFLDRLSPQMARWKRAGVAVADSAFAVEYTLSGTRGEALRQGSARVALGQQAPHGTIRYTLDGSAPTKRSRRYAAPVTVPLGRTIRAAAFDAAGQPLAAPRDFATARPALLARTSSGMKACPAGSLGLRVPLTPDATADAPAFNVNIFDACTAYPAAPLDVATGFTVEVARLARNYALAHEFDKVRGHFNATPHGELLVLAGCRIGAKERIEKGPKTVVAASFPLPDPAGAPQRMTFTGSLPTMAGDTDLCFQFTAPVSDPLYTVERVQLTEAAR